MGMGVAGVALDMWLCVRWLVKYASGGCEGEQTGTYQGSGAV